MYVEQLGPEASPWQLTLKGEILQEFMQLVISSSALKPKSTHNQNHLLDPISKHISVLARAFLRGQIYFFWVNFDPHYMER
jgi:hypothetical protein